MTVQTTADLKNLPTGFLIKVRYLGATDRRCSRWCATYRRNADETFRATTAAEDSGDRGEAAALACLAKINADRAAIVPRDRPFVIAAGAHDDDAFYYVATYPQA
jgi:hypothetical protein